MRKVLHQRPICQSNGIKTKMIKRIIEVPNATPSSAIQHDFGIINLALDLEMEKVRNRYPPFWRNITSGGRWIDSNVQL